MNESFVFRFRSFAVAHNVLDNKLSGLIVMSGTFFSEKHLNLSCSRHTRSLRLSWDFLHVPKIKTDFHSRPR